MFNSLASVISRFRAWLTHPKHSTWVLVFVAIVISVTSTTMFYLQDQLVTYGDAESHLNISKRVVHSLTPGAAQLGGIWLPLPHLLMVPFVYFDSLWRTGLAGAIVSGASFVVAALFIYKFILLISRHQLASWAGFFIFALNPNVLYLQSTAMTEVPLLAFFILSSYYFVKFLMDTHNLLALVLASFFGFAATLTRYDGWFLVLFQAGIIALLYLPKAIAQRSWEIWKTMEGTVLMFATVAFFGIGLWLLWDYLILGDPLYFTRSEFSAKSQQQGWLARGELPTYHNLPLSLSYYSMTSLENIGAIVTVLGMIGLVLFAIQRTIQQKWHILLLLLVPFIFYVTTMYLGQSVIFIPSLTPDTFEWQLFNVRYGMMMIPMASVFAAYTLSHFRWRIAQSVILLLIAVQSLFFLTGKATAISWQDGVSGLSASKRTDAERWIRENYDSGLVLIDDFARTVSIVRSDIPMQNIIYVGNKPYWEESLETPEKHATWIVMQENDTLWTELNSNPQKQAHMYKYYEKAYTSPTILIFKRRGEALSDASL